MLRDVSKFLTTDDNYHWLLVIPAAVLVAWVALKVTGRAGRRNLLVLYVAGCLCVTLGCTVLLSSLKTFLFNLVVLTPQAWLMALMAIFALIRYRHPGYVPHLWLFLLVALLGHGCTTVWILGVTAPS